MLAHQCIQQVITNKSLIYQFLKNEWTLSAVLDLAHAHHHRQVHPYLQPRPRIRNVQSNFDGTIL